MITHSKAQGDLIYFTYGDGSSMAQTTVLPPDCLQFRNQTGGKLD